MNGYRKKGTQAFSSKMSKANKKANKVPLEQSEEELENPLEQSNKERNSFFLNECEKKEVVLVHSSKNSGNYTYIENTCESLSDGELFMKIVDHLYNGLKE